MISGPFWETKFPGLKCLIFIIDLFQKNASILLTVYISLSY